MARPIKKSIKKSSRPKTGSAAGRKPSSTGSRSGAPKRPSGDDRPPRKSSDSSTGSRFEKRPGSFSDRPDRFKKSGAGEEKSGRSYSSKSEGGERSSGRGPKPSFARGRDDSKKFGSSSRPSGDRNERGSGGLRGNEKIRRTHSDDKPDQRTSERAPRSYGNSSDRGPRSSGGTERPRRSYSDDKPDRDSASGGSRPYTPRGEGRTGTGGGNDRPKRPYSSERSDSGPSRDRKTPYSNDSKDRGSSRTGDSTFKKKTYGDSSDENRPARRSYGDSEKSGTGFKKSYGSERRSGRTPYRRKELEVPTTPSDGTERLNKFLSNAGIASRREADELIKLGLVQVNGEVILELGHKINPRTDKIQYDGKIINKEKLRYIILNKPKDFITTTDDPRNRKTVMALVEGMCRERIYPVGRLDRQTTGLLLFTNDGDLAKRLLHPKHGYPKIYHIELVQKVKGEHLRQIKEGFDLEDGFIQADEISYVGDGADQHQVGIRIHSGRNRIVRRIFEHFGYTVKKLDRVSFSGLTKKDLPRGRARHLTEKEVEFLMMIR